MINRALFREFRKDGWPLCPRCEEDELWSSVAIAASRAVTLEECFKGEFTCYYCNWQSEEAERRVKRVDALFWEKFRNRYPDHPWLELQARKERAMEATRAELAEYFVSDVNGKGLRPEFVAECSDERLGCMAALAGDGFAAWLQAKRLGAAAQPHSPEPEGR